MSKRTVGLIVVLILITGILFYFALSQPAPKPSDVAQMPTQPTPTPTISPAHTTLALLSTTTGTVNVVMNSNGDNTTAVQLDLAFDPTVLKNVKVSNANFYTPSIELFNQVNQVEGKVSYAVAIPPTGQAKSGQGTVAIISYTRAPGARQATMIKFMGKTKVTAEGISPSVLKSTADVTIPATQ